MRPYTLIVDDFFQDFNAARAHALSLKYDTIVNPYDELPYPTIALLPDGDEDPVSAIVHRKLNGVMGSKLLTLRSLFRLTLQDDPQPYQAHSDAFMGAQFTAIIYMNRQEDCRGGTSLLTHRATGARTWDDDTPGNVLSRLYKDQNVGDAWEVDMLVPMRANRCAVIAGNIIHRSEPTEGFGRTLEDGRMVMIYSFNLLR